MSSSSEAKPSRRINFPQATKLALAKRAGFHCSYPACLIPTTGPTVSDDGDDSAAGIAIAAHIYPASENGPRKNIGITQQQIKDVSNGIWLCRTHGAMIDDFQSDFPAEKVIEMKRVREFAQELTIQMPDVAYFLGWIGVKRLDAIVWKHWPNPDKEQIKLEVISEGIKCTPTSEDSIWTQMPVPPSEFELKPMSKASVLVTFTGSASTSRVRNNAYSAERRRAVQIVSAWTEQIKKWGWDGEGFYVNHGYVKITARNPETGELAEPFIWTRGRTASLYCYNIVNGESIYLDIDNTENLTSGLNWHLNVTIDNGECSTKSSLRMRKLIAPRNSYQSHERAEILAFSQVLEKLASGWEPVGFVGLEPGEWSAPETTHPEAFTIKSEIPKAQIDKALQRCAKVRLGYELAEIWGRCFHFNDAFFNDALNESAIRKASDDLLEMVGPAPYPLYAQGDQIVAINDNYGIRLTIKRGDLLFDVVNTKYCILSQR